MGCVQMKREKEPRCEEAGCISMITKGSAIPKKALLCNGDKIDIKKYKSLKKILKGFIHCEEYYLPDLREDEYFDYIIWY